jgi:hypothetical protein
MRRRRGVSRRSGSKNSREDDGNQAIEEQADLPVMSFDEATDVFANQWIFMEVTEQDEHGAPLRGRVLDHHRDRNRIQPTILKVVEEVKATRSAPKHVRGYSVFHGFRHFRTAAEWETYKRQIGWPGGERGSGRR